MRANYKTEFTLVPRGTKNDNEDISRNVRLKYDGSAEHSTIKRFEQRRDVYVRALEIISERAYDARTLNTNSNLDYIIQRSESLSEVLKNKNLANENDRNLANIAFKRVEDFVKEAPGYISSIFRTYGFQGKEMEETERQLNHLEYLITEDRINHNELVRETFGIDLRPIKQRLREAKRKVIKSPVTYATLAAASAGFATLFPEDSIQSLGGGAASGLFVSATIIKSEKVRNIVASIYDKLSNALG